MRNTPKTLRDFMNILLEKKGLLLGQALIWATVNTIR